MLFSATMPGPVVALARRFMVHPTHIRAQDPDDQNQTVNTVKQVIYRVHAMNKVEVISRILQAEGRGRTVIFCRTKRTAARLGEDLTARCFAVGALHGDLGQGAREQALRAFRNGKVDVLVATDVAARGIDVDDVTHVINYQCPEDEKIYIHRIGRTGRAGNSGTAVTFVDWDDTPRWSLISKALGLGVPDPLETYHTSPHLFTDLDIPEGTTGRLPRAKRTRAGLDAEVLEDLGGSAPRSEGRGRGGSRSGFRRLAWWLAWWPRAFVAWWFGFFLRRITFARLASRHPGRGSHAERRQGRPLRPRHPWPWPRRALAAFRFRFCWFRRFRFDWC